jgi:fatty-acyl-CoA synthase
MSMQVSSNSNYPPIALDSLLALRSAKTSQPVAFIENECNITQEQFLEQVSRIAAWLQSRGVGSGDRVAVWMSNRVEWLALLFALSRLGAALMAVNTRYRSEEVGHILSRSQARMLILQTDVASAHLLDVLGTVERSQLNFLHEIAVVDAPALLPDAIAGIPLVRLEPQAIAEPVASAGGPDDLCILFTTSGTTSAPKLVMHPQRTIAEHALRSAQFYGLDRPAARLLAALPLCGTFGLTGAMAAYAGGAEVYLMETFEADRAALLLKQHDITHTFGSDEMYRRILARVPKRNPFPRAQLFGFGAFSSSFADFATQGCEDGVPLAGLYGSSELQALFSLQPVDLPISQRIQGGGLPVAGKDAQVRVRDVATGELAPQGARGELEIRTPCAFAGYLNDAQATAKAILPDGYFRTGDLGYLRDDDTFVFEARMGDAIRIGGFLVNPEEIENVLKRVPGVADVQVVAVDIAAQPRPVAFVIAEAGSSIDGTSMTNAARANLASFKVPARVWFVEEFPVTASANGVKIQRNKLRDWALARLADETGGDGSTVSRPDRA